MTKDEYAMAADVAYINACISNFESISDKGCGRNAPHSMRAVHSQLCDIRAKLRAKVDKAVATPERDDRAMAGRHEMVTEGGVS